ncbi:MAG: XTP/dITP diphosphatase [Thermoplasmatota archaeon]
MSGRRKVYIITANHGKIREIKQWLVPLGIDVDVLSGDFVEIQSDSLEEVVYYGLKQYAEDHRVDHPFIKDDSGLFIKSLGGFPGVYSAYVHKTLGNEGIIRMMDGIEDRKAVFKTAVGMFIPGKGISIFRGEVAGAISGEIRGTGGFGYDPIFIPEGQERTFAEMTTSEKNSMSHRIRAVKQMVDYISRGDGIV